MFTNPHTESKSDLKVFSLVATFAFVALAAAGLTVSGGCGFYAGGDIGVTPGGQEDIAAARQEIAEGGIADPDAITVEGFLSEHTIPVEAPADADLLYATASVAWNHDFDAFTPLATVQIGLGTTLDINEFQRPDLNLTLLIDRSGSMDEFIDERTQTTKLDAVRIAVDRILARLTADDRVSVVTFNTRSRVDLENAVGTDLAAVKTVVAGIAPDGGSDLAVGLRRAFEVIRDHSSANRSDRIILFTDAELRRRADQHVQAFLDNMERYAQDNIGTTVFAVGSNVGHEIAYDISQIRGGNYFFLGTYDRIVKVIDDEFDYLVTPIAYDISARISVPFEFDVTEVHGIAAEPPFLNQLDLKVPTLFLSSRQGGGAIFVRIRPGALVDFTQEYDLAQINLSYETPDGRRLSHPRVTAVLPPDLDPDAESGYFETPNTQRGVLLLNTALLMKSACADIYRSYDGYYGYYYGSRDDFDLAIARLSEFLPYFDSLADGLEDRLAPNSRSLSEERALLAQLLANLREIQ